MQNLNQKFSHIPSQQFFLTQHHGLNEDEDSEDFVLFQMLIFLNTQLLKIMKKIKKIKIYLPYSNTEMDSICEVFGNIFNIPEPLNL